VKTPLEIAEEVLKSNIGGENLINETGILAREVVRLEHELDVMKKVTLANQNASLDLAEQNRRLREALLNLQKMPISPGENSPVIREIKSIVRAALEGK
jgi:inosine-uridine nucleoside N-ribohydrolase